MAIEYLTVNYKEYEIKSLLGKGKGGYSYLVQREQRHYVLKQIHHEPCAYYQFGNKLESELRDYDRLHAIDIPMPKMLDVDVVKERILKEYIDGPTAAQLVDSQQLRREYVEQIDAMCHILYAHHLNIDYYPTNFVLSNDKLYYVDYECNEYMEEWNFENWGKQYWIVKEALNS